MPHGLRSPETIGVVLMLTALAGVVLQRTLLPGLLLDDELDVLEVLAELEELETLVELEELDVTLLLDAALEELAGISLLLSPPQAVKQLPSLLVQVACSSCSLQQAASRSVLPV